MTTRVLQQISKKEPRTMGLIADRLGMNIKEPRHRFRLRRDLNILENAGKIESVTVYGNRMNLRGWRKL